MNHQAGAGTGTGAGTGAGFPRIRYNITDRSQRSVVLDVVLKLLALPDSRFAVTEVLDLLGQEAVMARFELETKDIDSIRQWLVSSGIRWGANIDHKQKFLEIQTDDLAALERNSWKFGLERLLLGVALPGKSTGIVNLAGNDIYPVDGIEGTQAKILGRFAHFCDLLMKACEFFNENRAATIDEWQSRIGFLIETFLQLPDEQVYMIRNTLQIFDVPPAIGFNRPIDLATIRAVLEDQLELSIGSIGFLNGGVNFTALVPMRTLPFKVVCLLGMDDKAFPRQQSKSGFDLMASEPRVGDRNARDDDRYLFIETLLSARKHFLVFWEGQSIRDNDELPPAVPVGDFLDLVSNSFDLVYPEIPEMSCSTKELRKLLITRHPLQAFSIKAFLKDPTNPKRGFDKRALKGAKKLANRDLTRRPKAFFTEALPDNPPDPWVVSVDDLARFLEHPIKYFLYRRLGIYLDDQESELQDRESFSFDYAQQWQFGDEYIKAAINDGSSWTDYLNRVGLEGRLPPGPLSQGVLAGVESKSRTIVDKVKDLRREPAVTDENSKENHFIDLEIAGVRIVGTLDNLQNDCQIFSQYSLIRPNRVLYAFVHHLFACTINEQATTFLVGRQGHGAVGDLIRFKAVGDDLKSVRQRALSLLEDIVNWYKYNWRCPLLLLPVSSKLYYDEITRESDNPDQLAARRAAFVDPMESDDSGYRDVWEAFLFGELDPWIDPITGQLPVFPWEEDGMCRTVDKSKLDLYRPEEMAMKVWPVVLEFMN